MLIGVVGWTFLGLIAGFIASRFADLRGDKPGLGIGLGAVGAVIGGWLYGYYSGNGVTPFNLSSLLIAGLGAILMLLSWHSWPRSAVPGSIAVAPDGFDIKL